MTYSVVVIGAGNIAGGYDTPASPQILTHLHAIKSEPRFACAALFDLDTGRAGAMGTVWDVPVAATLDEVLALSFDVAVIAVPDPHHATYLEHMLGHDAGLVLCEKPLTQDIAQARDIAARYKAAGKMLMVNYQRRFEESVHELRERLVSGALGKSLSGAVWYSKESATTARTPSICCAFSSARCRPRSAGARPSISPRSIRVSAAPCGSTMSTSN